MGPKVGNLTVTYLGNRTGTYTLKVLAEGKLFVELKYVWVLSRKETKRYQYDAYLYFDLIGGTVSYLYHLPVPVLSAGSVCSVL